jgi:tungstate transport system substrate-binding protein
MGDTGLWSAVADRFQKHTGHQVEIVAQGPKHVIAPVFIRGEADLISMHASDTIINLVADGYGVDPQPWARNDLVLVGPLSDPARIRGEKDAVAALRRIQSSGAKLLLHASLGANEVLHDLLADGEIVLDPRNVISLPLDRHREMLARASEERAYALVGRIPFLNGKIPNPGLALMVQGDPRLRRPYVVVVARRTPDNATRQAAARALAEFLRSAATQQWLAEFGRGQLDNQPLFFPVAVP